MQHANVAQPALDYFPCRYGSSKQVFRGPRRRLEGDYVAFIGGTETYGRFIDMPFPALVECDTGIRSINLGCANAGIDAFRNDPAILEICRRAKVTVIQVMGAQNMSNRYYSVHPRRNDRFLRPSSMMKTIYPEVDFTYYTFTRHMLTSLNGISPVKFGVLVRELQEAWVGRMQSMLSEIGGKVILLWLADQMPPERAAMDPGTSDPMFVDREMLAELGDLVSHTIEIEATRDERKGGLDEMFFADLERPAAEEMLGPVAHRRTAAVLAPLIAELV